MTTTPVFVPIAALDLSSVRISLMHRTGGYGWTEARTRAAEIAYREFLLLAKTFPGETRSPTRDVDVFWRFHILDTIKYARDCAMAFGYFLHHKPDLSLATGTPNSAQAVTRDKTVALMREALAAGGIAELSGYGAASNEGQYASAPVETARQACRAVVAPSPSL